MEGIEILNATEIYGQTWIGLFGLLFLIFGVFATVISLVEGAIKIAIILAIMTLVGVFGVAYDGTIHTATEYQAVVEDSVSYKELVDRYEIVEVKGKLFTLREKVTNETSLLSGGGDK